VPQLGRLPLVVCLATLGMGVGGVLLGANVAYAQSSAVPTRMAPLLVDPALLGGAPAVAPPSLPAALGGSLPAAASAKKAAGKKTAAKEPMAPIPATRSTEVPVSTPVAPTPAKTVAARSEPVAEPAVPETQSEPPPSPAPAPTPSVPAAPVAPTPRAPSSPLPVAAEAGRALRDQETPKAADQSVAETMPPQPKPQTLATQTAAKTPATALPKDQTELLADAITGRNDLELTATGHAELRRDGTILNADRIVYNIVEDNVDAQGNVLYRDPTQGTTMAGSDAEIVVAARTGYINNVNYEIRQQKQISQTNNAWSFNAPAIGSNMMGNPGGPVPMGSNATPNYGMAAGATLSQQPGQQTAINEAAAASADAETQAQATAAGQVAYLPGQSPLARIVETMSHGQAARINLQGENRYQAEDATYTTCPAGDSGWYLRASTYHADYEQNQGNVSNSLLYFQDVPFLYMPYAFFPLDRGRHSGFLSPSLGSSQLNGFQTIVPYYFNLAPNYDATFAPAIYGKRGISFNTEARYLGNTGNSPVPTYTGKDAFNYMPNDRMANRERWSFLSQHQQQFNSLLPGLSGAWDLQGVSDSYYFTDLNNSLAAMSQSYLPRTGRVNYAAPTWNASVVAQGYQTLNFNPSAPVATPYQLLPQVNFAMNRSLLSAAGFSNVKLNDNDELEVLQNNGLFDQPARLDALVSANSSYFTNQTQSYVQGNRLWAYPQLVTSWQQPGMYLTPKFGVHYTQYNTNAGQLTTSGAYNGTTSIGSDTASRTLPILSLDSGLVFDRKTQYFGRNLNQTLEPRLYYLYVPYRDQTNLPLFDTGVADVSYAQMFSENIFTGWDRVSNANQVTAALTSRYSLDKTGQQLMSFSLGQRVFFQPQQVNLYANQPTSSYGSNDYFAQAAGVVAPYTSINGFAQVSPYAQANSASNNTASVNRINRASIGGRFQPSRENVLNYTYRYQNQDYIPGAATSGMTATAVMQNDVSAAWKIWGPLRAVGRYTYSAVQSSQIESLAGLEYNASCWTARAVYHRAMTYSSTQTPFLNTSFFVQLELKGMGSIGSSPLDVLRRNVPNYTRTSDAAFMPPLTDPYY
jgi:LPS-assembly protein